MPKPAELSNIESSDYVEEVVPMAEGMALYRLAENQSVVAADFESDAVMAGTLDRISAYVEVDGKKRVRTDRKIEELRNEQGGSCGVRIFGNKIISPEHCGIGEGHDLSLKDIAAFFNAASSQKVSLTEGEGQLLNQLIAGGLLAGTKGRYLAPQRSALIGMSRSYEADERYDAFIHEYSHALYFIDENFRAQVGQVWKSLRPEEQRFLKGALIASIYTSAGQALIETEAQAYAVGHPLSDDGLVPVMDAADRNCSDHGQKIKAACNDFYSYRGNLRTLLRDLNRRYTEAFKRYIPYLGGEIFLGAPLVLNPVDAALTALQLEFDKRHPED